MHLPVVCMYCMYCIVIDVWMWLTLLFSFSVLVSCFLFLVSCFLSRSLLSSCLSLSSGNTILYDGAMEATPFVPTAITFCIETVPVSDGVLVLDPALCGVYEQVMFQRRNHNNDHPYIPPSTSAKALEKEEKDLLRSNSGANADTSPTASATNGANGEDTTTLTDDDVACALLRTYCTRSLVAMLRDASSAKVAVQQGLLPPLLRLSSSPVLTLADTVSVAYMEHRHMDLRTVMYDIATGGVVLLDARPPVNKKETALTPEEQKRHGMAEQLMQMGIHGSQEKDLYLFGLEENGDDLNRALDWFMSGAADAGKCDAL